MTYIEIATKLKEIARICNAETVKLSVWTDGWYWDQHCGRFFYHAKDDKECTKEGLLRDLAHWTRDIDKGGELWLHRYKTEGAVLEAEVIRMVNRKANPNYDRRTTAN